MNIPSSLLKFLKQHISGAIDYAKSIPGFLKVNERNPMSDRLGYKGHAIIYRTSNGVYGEVQVNTPEMIYAKETESRGRKMLGDKKYEEIARRIGVKGGLGHQLFEEWRVLNDETDLRRKKEIQNQSKQYYSHFFMSILMKYNIDILQDLISKGKTVYFEWEFEEIALKYRGDGNYEAKNKGYGGAFSVKYSDMLVAEALLSNPRIITKEEYDNY